MEKEYLERLINEGNSLNTIAKLSGRGLTIVRYWTKKYGLSSTFALKNKKEYTNFRHCPGCDQHIKVEEFYNKPKKNKWFSLL
ncbi:hypothetical protein EBU94_08700 [bacterium]|nr:hypothetical protein [bacterium]